MAENINGDLLLHSHPVEIYRACDSMFEGEAWLNWEPETLLMALEGEVSPQAEDKLLAIQSAASNSSFPLVDSTAFEKLVLAWCKCICVMDARQPPYVMCPDMSLLWEGSATGLSCHQNCLSPRKI